MANAPIRKLTDFFREPHFPFFLLSLIRKLSPPLARVIKYGRLNPNTEEYWNQRYSTGEYGRGEDERYGDLREKVLNLVPFGSSVLDVGCGTGRFMELLKDRKACTCTGLDISKVSVELAKQKGFPAFQCRLPVLPPRFPTNRFDVCTVIETLEHITETERTLRELSTTLREGGRIVIAVPNDCMKPEEFDEHVASYTSQSLGHLVSRCFLVDTNFSVESLGFKYLVMTGRKVNSAKQVSA